MPRKVLPLPETNELSLAGKVAVVTGGSNGIGAATVKTFAAHGATVVVGYHKGEERARALIASLPGDHDSAVSHRALQIVLEDSATMARAAAEVRSQYGRCDILVNSAGITKALPHGNLDALDDALFDSIMVANVRGPFAMIRAFAPLLRETGESVVINISSISGFTGSGSSIAYCASKAALDTMTISLGRALGPQIRVLCVSPAAVATDFLPGRDRAALEKFAAATPLRKVNEPEDVARTILAAVTLLKTTTGAKIICDGGRFIA
jgi:3-oxoacyl-[acyl-carrier protein] reductase